MKACLNKILLKRAVKSGMIRAREHVLGWEHRPIRSKKARFIHHQLFTTTKYV